MFSQARPNRARGLKRAAGAAGRSAVRAELRALNPKFHPGQDPIELEASRKVIMPTERQQLDKMTSMLEQAYSEGTPEQQQALALWKFQVDSGSISDQVKLQFMRSFYFWLLGCGAKDDHDKTLWGRGNAATYNGEVREYIDMFLDKRKEYAMKLILLANRVPDTLYGYYLYFKVSLFVSNPFFLFLGTLPFLLTFFKLVHCARQARADNRREGHCELEHE